LKRTASHPRSSIHPHARAVDADTDARNLPKDNDRLLPQFGDGEEDVVVPVGKVDEDTAVA
jgi:hypothetical protein